MPKEVTAVCCQGNINICWMDWGNAIAGQPLKIIKQHPPNIEIGLISTRASRRLDQMFMNQCSELLNTQRSISLKKNLNIRPVFFEQSQLYFNCVHFHIQLITMCYSQHLFTVRKRMLQHFWTYISKVSDFPWDSRTKFRLSLCTSTVVGVLQAKHETSA
jgi:hypothetical protein